MSSRDELAVPVLALKDVEGLSLGDERGSGSFGAVYEVTVNGVPRIAKKLHNILVCSSNREAIQEKFRYECHLLSKLNHPNIVEFVGVHFGVEPSDLSLLMEKLHTDLEHFLSRKTPRHPRIPISIKLSILSDVLSGLGYLHTQSPAIIHRDLTAGNVLLTRDLRAKIADLGVSKLLDLHPNEIARQTSCPGALAYMPPEALHENPEYGTELDVFSFGQLSLFVAIQEFPIVYDASDNPGMMSIALQNEQVQILKRQKWIKILKSLPDDQCLQDVVQQCLHDKPHRRPTTKELHRRIKTLSVQHSISLSDVILSWGDETEFSAATEDLNGLTHSDLLAKYKSDTSKLKESVKIMGQKIEELHSDLCGHDVELKEKSMLVEELKGHLDGALQKEQETQMDMEVYQVQAKTYMDDFEEERRDRARAHAHSETLKEKVEMIQAELTDAKAQVKSYEKQVSELEKRCKKYQKSNEPSRIRPFAFSAKRRQRTASETAAVEVYVLSETSEQPSLQNETRMNSATRTLSPTEMSRVQSLSEDQLPIIIDKESIGDLFAVVNKLERYERENDHLKRQLTEIQASVLQLATSFDSLSQASLVRDQQLIQKEVSFRITNLMKFLSSTL